MSATEKEREVQESEMKFVDRGLTPTPPGEKGGAVEASVEIKLAMIHYNTNYGDCVFI